MAATCRDFSGDLKCTILHRHKVLTSQAGEEGFCIQLVASLKRNSKLQMILFSCSTEATAIYLLGQGGHASFLNEPSPIYELSIQWHLL